jgi:hypothetical protein
VAVDRHHVGEHEAFVGDDVQVAGVVADRRTIGISEAAGLVAGRPEVGGELLDPPVLALGEPPTFDVGVGERPEDARGVRRVGAFDAEGRVCDWFGIQCPSSPIAAGAAPCSWARRAPSRSRRRSVSARRS